MRTSVAVTIAVLAGLAGGCKDTGVPTTLVPRPEGQFILRAVQGNPLPAEAYSGYRVVADTLTLRSDGSGVDRGEGRYLNAKSGGEEVVPVNRALGYSLNGSRISVTFICIACNSVAGASLSGEVTRDGIRFDQSNYSRVPLVYEKLR